MLTVLNVYKPIGKTPLEAIEALKTKFPEYRDKKITYAGRLDPMAHGVLMLLVCPETKRAREYHNLDKEYICQGVIGFSTDTYDILGIPQNHVISNEDIQAKITTNIGRHKQTYPPYSSATVMGKPLFQWAREGKLSEIAIPQKEIEIYELELMSTWSISTYDLQNTIEAKIRSVNGDFRQEEIHASWKKHLDHAAHTTYPAFSIRCRCSSGSYMRSLIHALGIQLGSGAVTLDIYRTRVGKWTIDESMRL